MCVRKRARSPSFSRRLKSAYNLQFRPGSSSLLLDKTAVPTPIQYDSKHATSGSTTRAGRHVSRVTTRIIPTPPTNMASEDMVLADLIPRIEDLTRQHAEWSRTASEKGQLIHDLRVDLEVQQKRNEETRQELDRLLAMNTPLPPNGSTSVAAQGADCQLLVAAESCPNARASSSAPMSRPARVIIGACMPHGLVGGSSAVLSQVLDVLGRVSRFADVRLVLTRELAKQPDAERINDRVQDVVVRDAKAANHPSSSAHDGDAPAQDARVFTWWDMESNPHHCAKELARWGDVLMVSPLCDKTLNSMSNGHDNDLLLELVQMWMRAKKRVPHGSMWVPAKPFTVCPRLPVEARNQLEVEEQLEKLHNMGVDVMEDPMEAASTKDGFAAYVAQLVEHIRHQIITRQCGQHSHLPTR